LVARTLVTTADERTWPTEEHEPVLFLGEWCKRYSRKEKWDRLDWIVVPYHWDDREKLYTDYQYLQELYEKLLVELSDKLNQIHSVKHSIRYWRILIGPWLGWFIQILFDRRYMLEQAIEEHKITACSILERDPLSIIPNDMEHFIKFIVEDDWNEAVYTQLLQMCYKGKIELLTLKNEKQKLKYKGTNHDANKGIKIQLKKGVGRFVDYYNRLFSRNHDYFFISTYLPLKLEFNLQVRLGQFPKFWRSKNIPNHCSNILLRQWQLNSDNSDDKLFDAIARKMIPLHIPTSYLEGYKELVNFSNQLPWPDKPKAIFTSNSYSSDDLFKVWSAQKVDNATPFVIGQHGGHLGMAPFSFHEEHQVKIADKWISWGWRDKLRPNITPLGNLKNTGIEVEYDASGGALLVEVAISRYSNHVYAIPISSQWLNYFDEQKRFLKALPLVLRKQVLLRLKGDYGWDQVDRWQSQLPEVKINQDYQNIHKLIRKSRLYISTYNSTTYLDSLFWNIPTLMFWNPEHWELNEETKPYFKLLEDVGIFHKTPESAAQKMIEIWDNVDLWWMSEQVQSVRNQICDQYSKICKHPVSELESIMVGVI
jgi:putative transferase (TIGR04331 family)